MLESIKGWLIGLSVAALLALAGWGLYAFGHHEYTAGAQSVQVQWDAAKGAADQAKLKQAANVITGDTAQAAGFVAIDSTYQQALANAKATSDPFILGAASPGSLRPIWQCSTGASQSGSHHVGNASVPAAAAGAARPNDAAAGAAGNRLKAALAVVSVGDQADTEIAKRDAKITGLQALVRSYEARGSPAPATSAPVKQ